MFTQTNPSADQPLNRFERELLNLLSGHLTNMSESLTDVQTKLASSNAELENLRSTYHVAGKLEQTVQSHSSRLSHLEQMLNIHPQTNLGPNDPSCQKE